jgi:DNA-binding transcriptional regulator YhcF (GntR family)
MADVLNKPLYVQIQEYIAELILSGKLLPETKIQSERDFSEELGVSRMTVRKALTELVSEGLLERRSAFLFPARAAPIWKNGTWKRMPSSTCWCACMG